MATSTDTLHVELVAADRLVWSGEAEVVVARTIEGDVGILPNHAPMLSLLAEAVIEISPSEGPVVIATADGGFLSVAENRVSLLSEEVLLAEEINVEQAYVELENAKVRLGEDDDAHLRIRRAEAQIRAVEKYKHA
ncbi:F0F1 ATP synthase subunit epsilon [Nocardioides insulae]|uniref:F0F1 ATP synthase subunit epsilon n=1 Tax=Nocardioides insulae TaxID=394734 RepID=UPI0003FEB910|nr:F0F1 ATP synthase subunit epsilon [Nocardioides insulae]